MSDTQDTQTTQDAMNEGEDQSNTSADFEQNREKMRRDHFPGESKGRNFQDYDDYEPDPEIAELAVLYPEVDSNEALTEKIADQYARPGVDDDEAEPQ